MKNRFSGMKSALGALAVYTSGLFGCNSPQVSHAPSTVQPEPPRIERAPLRRYDFETAYGYGHMNLSSTESVNGRSTSIYVDLYDTDGDRRTVEQAIVSAEGKTVMFVRHGAKVARQPMSSDDVRMMTPENERLFDRQYGGSDE